MTAPSLSVVVPAYNAERYIGQTLESILGQTHPPDEVIVVDDGSTDGTLSELRRFRGEVRVIMRVNGGAAAAHNTGFGEARGDYVARCDADDLWEPTKLERQVESLVAYPEVDIAMTGAWVFGAADCLFLDHTGAAPPPSSGVLEPRAFAQRLYRANMLCASSAIIRRSLQQRLGPFQVPLPNEDYEYWLRALKAGAVFYYDPTVLVRYRRHGANVTNNLVAMYRAAHLVHRQHADLVDSRALVRQALAHDLFMIGRLLYDQRRPRDARAAFAASMRQWPSPRTAAWTAVLSVPETCHRALADVLVSIKRAFDPVTP